MRAQRGLPLALAGLEQRREVVQVRLVSEPLAPLRPHLPLQRAALVLAHPPLHQLPLPARALVSAHLRRLLLVRSVASVRPLQRRLRRQAAVDCLVNSRQQEGDCSERRQRRHLLQAALVLVRLHLRPPQAVSHLARPRPHLLRLPGLASGLHRRLLRLLLAAFHLAPLLPRRRQPLVVVLVLARRPQPLAFPSERRPRLLLLLEGCLARLQLGVEGCSAHSPLPLEPLSLELLSRPLRQLSHPPDLAPATLPTPLSPTLATLTQKPKCR